MIRASVLDLFDDRTKRRAIVGGSVGTAIAVFVGLPLIVAVQLDFRSRKTLRTEAIFLS